MNTLAHLAAFLIGLTLAILFFADFFGIGAIAINAPLGLGILAIALMWLVLMFPAVGDDMRQLRGGDVDEDV